MASYHKWDVKNGFAYVLTFFSFISDGLGGVAKSLLYNIYTVPGMHLQIGEPSSST